MKRSRADPILVIGIVLSTALAVLLYFITSQQALLSFLVGLVGTVIALLIDLISRVKQDAKLTRAVEQVDWLEPLVTDVASAVATVVKSDRLERFEGVAKARVEDCQMYLEDLRHGHVRVPAGDFEFSFEQMEQAKSNIRSTSVGPISSTWWRSQLGQKYWQLNLDAVARGVSVERIFIFEHETTQLQAIIDEQFRAGIQTFVILLDEVPHDLRFDYIVWDHSCTMEVKLSADGIETDFIYSVNEADIRMRLDNFRRIKLAARKYKGEWFSVEPYKKYGAGWHGPVREDRSDSTTVDERPRRE